MNGLIKIMIFKGLKTRFKGFKSILIKVKEGYAVVETEHGVCNEKIGTVDEKYFVMLAETYDMKVVNDIFCSVEKDCVVIRGDKNLVL